MRGSSRRHSRFSCDGGRGRHSCRSGRRRLDRGFRWLHVGSSRGRRGFGFGSALQLATDFVGHVHRDGAGVGLLLRYTKAWQEVDNGLGLDLEFAGQFVNTDLRCVTHASLRILLFLLRRGIFIRCVGGRGVSLSGGFRFGCG